MNLFYQICHKVSNKHYFQQLMLKQQQNFDIHPYKIDKIYSQAAKKIYKQITNKYLITNQLQKQNNLWHQNERKIFIWFIVCYFHQIKSQDPIQTQINWNHLSNVFFDKSPEFLKFQFLNIIKIKKRVIWTNQEDQLLVKTLQYEGIGKWNQISKSLYFQSNGNIFKTPKHCRQRWLNHLDDKKNKGQWTTQQDYKIFSYVKQYGGKWSKIVQILNHTRTQHMVKNRFNSLLTKYRKNKKQKDIQTIDKILKILNNLMNSNTNEEVNIQSFNKQYQYKQKQQIKNQTIQQHQNQQIYKYVQPSLKQIPSFDTKFSQSFQYTPPQSPIFFQGAFSPLNGSKNTLNHWELRPKNNIEILSINNLYSQQKQIYFMFENKIAEKIQYKIKSVHIIIKN